MRSALFWDINIFTVFLQVDLAERSLHLLCFVWIVDAGMKTDNAAETFSLEFCLHYSQFLDYFVSGPLIVKL
jgi:hypothetical protein